MENRDYFDGQKRQMEVDVDPYLSSTFGRKMRKKGRGGNLFFAQKPQITLKTRIDGRNSGSGHQR